MTNISLKKAEGIFRNITTEDAVAYFGRNTYTEAPVYVLGDARTGEVKGAYPLVGRLRGCDRAGYIMVPNYFEPEKGMELPCENIRNGIIKTFKVKSGESEKTVQIVVCSYVGTAEENKDLIISAIAAEIDAFFAKKASQK